jgi:hypothetical protein
MTTDSFRMLANFLRDNSASSQKNVKSIIRDLLGYK